MYKYIKKNVLDEILSKRIIRHAARAIVFKDNQILLVRTNKGDLKFPGGGVNSNETLNQCLIREVLEETGYLIECNNEPNIFCHYVEQKLDQFCNDAIFESNSYYIFAELLSSAKNRVKLDEYEMELNFKAEWISINDAIFENTKVLLEQENPNPWVERELIILMNVLQEKI